MIDNVSPDATILKQNQSKLVRCRRHVVVSRCLLCFGANTLQPPLVRLIRCEPGSMEPKIASLRPARLSSRRARVFLVWSSQPEHKLMYCAPCHASRREKENVTPSDTPPTTPGHISRP